LWLALGALCVALATRESTVAVHALLERAAWLTQPVRVAQRVAWVLALAGVCAAARAWIPIVVAPIETIGRASLLLYWLHLEFAFGAASSAFSRSLDYKAWAIGTLGLVLAMWLVAQIRVGLRTRTFVPLSDEPSRAISEEPDRPRERTRSAPG
jgi:fucose 4-O-acetylase-like acetyltransferase